MRIFHLLRRFTLQPTPEIQASQAYPALPNMLNPFQDVPAQSQSPAQPVTNPAPSTKKLAATKSGHH
jgi:hypothetical protein